MSEQLDAFLQNTEATSAGINHALQSKGIQYPFIFVTSLTDVELTYLAENQYIVNNKIKDDYLPFYLKLEKGYKLLGYVELNWSTLIHICYLKYHPTYIKTDKEHISELTGELFDSLLLSS